ncbi:major facilitator superfamily transporter [Apiospora kogelbergensis]|uniref:Major facilitator superfamily transporter n=1 Tax=Apiospora kogelbergensis TaxID=1337665 RepID=A0AAW0QXT8_9PEZI
MAATWPSHERKPKWKVDCTVLPLLTSGLLAAQIDKMNLASALTAGFASDISVDQNTINLGNQLMYLGVVILEIPSNLLLQRIGPQRWISGQVLTFGFVAICQVFITNKIGFLVSRAVLGLTESGYIPAALFTLSTWYTKEQLAKRLAVFFFGMFGGNAIAPILASGILKLDGVRGLKGWQWLFLIEGLFTLVIAVTMFLFLPALPETKFATVTPKIADTIESSSSVTSQEELSCASMNPNSTVNGTAEGVKEFNFAVVWKTLTHYRRWLHFVASFCVFSTWSPLTTYTPSIIMSFGFDRITANALAAVGPFLALLVIFAMAVFSDRTNKRGLVVIIAVCLYLIVLVIARSVQPHAGKWPRWGLWTAVNAFAVGYHPVHNTWLQLNCEDPRERSISVAYVLQLYSPCVFKEMYANWRGS